MALHGTTRKLRANGAPSAEMKEVRGQCLLQSNRSNRKANGCILKEDELMCDSQVIEFWEMQLRVQGPAKMICHQFSFEYGIEIPGLV